MKVLVSRRSFLPRLDICLVLYCSLILLGLRVCDARTVIQENSGVKVEEVHEDLTKSSVNEASHINQELKGVDEVGAIKDDKRLRRVTETVGKSDKENEDVKVKGIISTHDVVTDKKVLVDESVESHLNESLEKSIQRRAQKGPKRVIKRLTRGWKRDDQNAKEEAVKAFEKDAEDKPEISDHIGLNKKDEVEGIRRLDVDVDEEVKRESHGASKVNVRTSVSENIDKPVHVTSGDNDKVHKVNLEVTEYGRSQEIDNKFTVTGVQSSDGLFKESTVVESYLQSEGILKDSQEISKLDEDPKHASNRADAFSRLQFLKNQAVELQQKIRNNTFLQNLKEQVSEVLPDFPKVTENQFLEMLNTIISKKNIQPSSEINTDGLKDSGLNDNQIEIIKCAQQLIAQKERQSFFDSMTECIRGLNVINCMRIFIYPIIVENMPEAFTQGLQNLPIEINIADILQGNRDKPKSARQAPFITFYTAPLDPESILFDILMEGLLRNPPNENLSSYIYEKNETFSKLLSCNRLQLLQMTEKFLPQNERQGYSDEMLSCVRRFEYLSCLKYFSWPTIRKYYPALPEFPISDSYITSLVYPNYPIISYPGLESGFGHLPEVVESGPSRMKPETVIMNIFKKTLSETSRIITPPTPVQLKLIVKNPSINQEQMATVYLAEQLIPVNLRADYVTNTIQCITQYDYYNCMKHATWPILRQFNPSLPQFPSLQDIINNFNVFFSQFQLPQFQLPQFQLPEVPNLSLPDFSTFFPFGQQTTTTAKPPVANSTSDTASSAKKRNDTIIESKIYKILKDVRDSMGATPLSPATYTNRKVFLFPLMTEEQSKIFALAEGIVPPIAREPLITNIYFCLNDKNEFSTCARTIIWPSIQNYVKGLPEFPSEIDDLLQQKLGINVPFERIMESGDYFIMRQIEKFFSEDREDAMYYIIRSIQLSTPESFNMQKILEILRSIEFNMPDFVNIQKFEYPRIPEFSVLSENQENIVHATESIIPEEIRLKFRNDMIDCARKNKFTVCSRNIIFPYIYRYFQRALLVPYYDNMSDKNSFPKINPVRVETKVNTEKEGENTVIITDSKIMPIFPSNPELVIFDMLRKVIISTPSVLKYPNESIAYSREFREAFSMRQANILIVAEAILPEEYRKGLLEEMYKCNSKDSFLNCTRDIVFPAMVKVYPDFPSFPDFENELNRSNMLSVIDSLNKQSSLPRTYNSRKTLPSMELIYKFLPESKTDVLQILVDRLPSSLYYDLYIKMTQCIQFSDGISCGNDIIYPTLKHYYDAPGFNIDDYYPITAQNPLSRGPAIKQYPMIDYEILCENLGFSCTLIPFGSRSTENFFNAAVLPNRLDSYIPFGKLPDGSRIFKHSQDTRNSIITPSVGAVKTSIPTFAVQSSSSFIDFTKIPIHPQGQTNAQNIKNLSDKFLQRYKRNIDDLLDSYSDAVPEDKRNAVRRRIPPKLTFPNITETELLQILVSISKRKHNRTPGDVNLNKYFVDSLNETDRAMITADQYEILKLVQGLNSETGKAGFMSRLVQCIRSLSFLRCIGIFAWPIIVSNLPSLPFNVPAGRNNPAEEEQQIQELFGVTATEFKIELLNRKEFIESNFIQWYKTLTEKKFETSIGPLKIQGYGDGEIAVTISDYREGRILKIKDNKNLPSILTIISEVIEEIFDTKPNKTKNKNTRKGKRDRSLHSFENSNMEKFLRKPNEEENAKRSLKDDQVINMLLERVRSSTADAENEDMRHYYNIEDAYRAFQVLFGPRVTERLSNQFKSLDIENFRSLEKNFEGLKVIDELQLVPLEAQGRNLQEKLKSSSSKSRALYGFDTEQSIDITKDPTSSDKLSKFKAYVEEYIKKYLYLNKKKMEKGLMIRLPRLNDEIVGRKMTSNLSSLGKSLKTKMKQMMPGAGLAVSFLVQLVLAHAKAAATVSEILSNMALGSAMLGIVRDTLFGSNNEPKVKVIYDTENHDSGISWPSAGSDSTINFTPPSKIYSPSPHFHQAYFK